MPYSGPASSYGVIGKAEAAYFKMINAQGGINGRKINFISYDDAYSPPKAIEQARKLVEGDEVLLVFQPLGTPSNKAIQKYMNAKKVPQLFVASGGTKFGDPKNFPWTMGWQPTYQTEGRIYAKYILDNCRRARSRFSIRTTIPATIIKGLRDGLGEEGQAHDHGREFLRSGRDHRRLPGGRAESIRRRHLLRRGLAEVRRSGHQEGRRDRLEADLFPGQHLEFGGRGAQAGGSGKLQGHHFLELPQGSDRPDVEGRSRHQAMVGLHGQIFSRR